MEYKLMRRFRSCVLCGREELLLVRTWTFLTFQIFNMHKNLRNVLKERKYILRMIGLPLNKLAITLFICTNKEHVQNIQRDSHH